MLAVLDRPVSEGSGGAVSCEAYLGTFAKLEGMAAVLEVFARWESLGEELEIAGALTQFCLSPHNSDWLLSLEESYPSARQAWKTAEQSLAQLIAIEGSFELTVSSVSMLEGARDDSKPNYVPTLSIGFIDGLSVNWKDPTLVKAAKDLAGLLEALGATWCQPITLD